MFRQKGLAKYFLREFKVSCNSDKRPAFAILELQVRF
jgi:hypothetical protein